MKPLKPGQLCTINDEVYRAKRKTSLCKGCSFDFASCPNQWVGRNPKLSIDCITHWIILQKVEIKDGTEKNKNVS